MEDKGPMKKPGARTARRVTCGTTQVSLVGIKCATEVRASVIDGIGEHGEHVVLMREMIERANLSKHALMVGTWSLQQNCDAFPFELLHDLAERVRAGRIEHLDLGKPQDDDFDVRDRGQFRQEPFRCTEEENSVESIRDDMFVKEFLFRCVIDFDDRYLDELDAIRARNV